MPLTIGSETIHPGETITLALPLPELFSCAPIYMPIKIVHGKEAGPCLVVMASIQGNELNGTEIINRVLDSLNSKRIKGTLIAIPVLNVYGLMNHARLLTNEIKLNYAFPGSNSGSHASRLAHIFVSEIFSKANYSILLQTGATHHINLPQLYIDFSNAEEKTLAAQFGSPVISHATTEPGSIRSVAKEKNIPLIVLEAGEAMRFNEDAIKIGTRGIHNIMQTIGMLGTMQKKSQKIQPHLFSQDNIWIRASNSGICKTKLKLGQHVHIGEILCMIHDPFGTNDSITIKSPSEGMIVGKNNLPLVHEGEALFKIALFSPNDNVQDHLKTWESHSCE